MPGSDVTTHRHESEPKAPTSPSSITTLTLLSGLRNFSQNHPGGELNKTEGTSSVQQIPSLSCSREQNHTGGLKPFSRSDMPLRHCWRKYHLARLLTHFSKWPPGVAILTPRRCSLRSAAGWRNVFAALGASPEVLETMGAAVGRCSQKGKM
jgi:hypothetical protein